MESKREKQIKEKASEIFENTRSKSCVSWANGAKWADETNPYKKAFKELEIYLNIFGNPEEIKDIMDELNQLSKKYDLN